LFQQKNAGLFCYWIIDRTSKNKCHSTSEASLHCRDDRNLSLAKPLLKPSSIQTAECGYITRISRFHMYLFIASNIAILPLVSPTFVLGHFVRVRMMNFKVNGTNTIVDVI
jgi:hypothetical protein